MMEPRRENAPNPTVSNEYLKHLDKEIVEDRIEEIQEIIEKVVVKNL